jgi:hypothetical protein
VLAREDEVSKRAREQEKSKRKENGISKSARAKEKENVRVSELVRKRTCE